MNYPWYVPVHPENFIQIMELLLGDIICDNLLQCYADLNFSESRKKVILKILTYRYLRI